MKNGTLQVISMALFTLISVNISRADIKITTRTTVSGVTTGGTTYIKGTRQRDEQSGMATLYECDLKRVVTINDNGRKYFVMILDENGSPIMDDNSAMGQASDTQKGRNYRLQHHGNGYRRKAGHVRVQGAPYEDIHGDGAECRRL